VSDDIKERVLRAWHRQQVEFAIAEERSRQRFARMVRQDARALLRWADDGGRVP